MLNTELPAVKVAGNYRVLKAKKQSIRRGVRHTYKGHLFRLLLSNQTKDVPLVLLILFLFLFLPVFAQPVNYR